MGRKLKTSELGRISPEEYSDSEKSKVHVVLDNIRSGLNIGSVFRTCDAFRIAELHLCGICDKPPSKDIQKTALGASDNVGWRYWDNTLDCIKHLKEECVVMSIEQCEGSVDLRNIDLMHDKPVALVFGNEVRGVDQEVIDESDLCVSLEQFGTKHSLNVSVCAGIVIREFYYLSESR